MHTPEKIPCFRDGNYPALIYIEASYPAGWVTHLAGLNDTSYHTKQLSNDLTEVITDVNKLRSPVVLKII